MKRGRKRIIVQDVGIEPDEFRDVDVTRLRHLGIVIIEGTTSSIDKLIRDGKVKGYVEDVVVKKSSVELNPRKVEHIRQEISLTGRNIKVALLDSGVNTRHHFF